MQVAIAAVLGLLYFRIKAKGEKTTIQVPQRPGTGDGCVIARVVDQIGTKIAETKVSGSNAMW